MARQVLMSVVGIVLGLVIGMIVMTGLHFASMLVYPAPEGVELMSQEPENVKKLNAWFATLPAGAFLLATSSHGLGCMAAAAVAMLISGRRSLITPLIIGAIFTILGIMNLSSIPHPDWFPYVDIPIYLILAVTAGLILKRQPVNTKPNSAEVQIAH